MARRRVPAAPVEGEAPKPVVRRTRRKIEKEVSIPLVIKCESKMCEALLKSLTEVNSDLPLRICEQWRNRSTKVPPLQSRQKGSAASGRQKLPKRAKTRQKPQRSRRRPVTVHNPMCKPLLPNRLLLSLATLGQKTSASSIERDYNSRASQQILLEALGAPIEMYCQPRPLRAESETSSLTGSTQRGINGATYSWNNDNNMNRLELSDPNNIFNHIRNGLADCRLFGVTPFQEINLPSHESSLMECSISPQTEVDSGGSNVDIFKHVRNLLSESPICDPPNET